MTIFTNYFEIFLNLGHSNYYFPIIKRIKYNLRYRKININPQRKSSSDLGTNNAKKQIKENFITFEEMIKSRRNQAKRSIGVQVQSESSDQELYQYCKTIGSVNSMFHYKLQNSHYFLVEFAEESDQILKKCLNSNGSGIIPAKSPFLWFKASKSRGKFLNNSSKESSQSKIPLKYSLISSQQEIIEWIEQTSNLSDSMKVLFEGSRLDELGIRLRLLTARQIEMALEGLFPNIAVLPFGSTVNGLGKAGCDLDLVFQHDYKSEDKENDSFRLVQHHKSIGNVSGTRQHIQRQMEVLADIIQLYLPGCNSVKRILQAKVPIVKFSQEVTGVDCDLSMINMTGVYMSELLYLFGFLDPLARPLVFTVKQWAWACSLTNLSPGRWVTNFNLTLLTIFYLQVIKRLPSVDQLRVAADAKDKRVTEEIDCTFLRDITRFKWQFPPSTGEKDLSNLLKGFFDYYTRFDFTSVGISLNVGKTIPKPDFSPLYIVNPLERSANVSKNVSFEEVERLRIALRDATWNLETIQDEQKSFLNLIIKSPKAHDISPRKFIPNRMLSIKRLFRDS